MNFASDPIPSNLAGLARLYQYAPDQLQGKIKQLFLTSLSLEESLSLLARVNKRSCQELRRELLKEVPGLNSLLTSDKTVISSPMSVKELAKYFPYLDFEEQLSILRQYTEQPETVTELLHHLSGLHQDVTSFVVTAHILPPPDLELVAKRLRWSRLSKKQPRVSVSLEAWEALLGARSLKVANRVEILGFLGDRIQTKEAVLRECLQAEGQVALKAALLAQNYLPHLLTEQPDLMHRVAGELCRADNMLGDDVLYLLATLIQHGVVQERDLPSRQKQLLLDAVAKKKYRPIILGILAAFLKSSPDNSSINAFALEIGSRLAKLGEQQALASVLLPHLDSFSDDQIRTLISNFPKTDLSKTLSEELIKRNLVKHGSLPDEGIWQSANLDSIAQLVYETFTQTVGTLASLTRTLSEIAYRHAPAEAWVSRLPESVRTLVDVLMMQPVQELIGVAKGLIENGRDMVSKRWKEIGQVVDEFAKEVELQLANASGTSGIRKYLDTYLRAISDLQSLSWQELDQRIKNLQESMGMEGSPFTKYQKIKFQLALLESYLESFEERLTKDVGHNTANQFENLFIYLSDAGILEGPFDQAYLKLLASLGLSPIETRRGARVKFDPVRHQHLRSETPKECTVCTYGVAYRHNVVFRATVI